MIVFFLISVPGRYHLSQHRATISKARIHFMFGYSLAKPELLNCGNVKQNILFCLLNQAATRSGNINKKK